MITAGALIIFNVRDSIYRRRLRKRPYALSIVSGRNHRLQQLIGSTTPILLRVSPTWRSHSSARSQRCLGRNASKQGELFNNAPGMNRTCARGLGNRCSIH
jgi:hypothetical protein